MAKETLKNKQNQHETMSDAEIAELQEVVKNNAERGEKARSVESSPAEKSKEQLAEFEKAVVEKAKEGQNKASNTETVKELKHHKIPKKQKDAAYKKTLREAQKDMSSSEKAFSKFIHNPVVEKASEGAAKTVARPNSVLFGSAFAFLFSLVTYVVANRYGYPLSGSESIIAFAAGWVFGVIVDYFRVIITGKTND